MLASFSVTSFSASRALWLLLALTGCAARPAHDPHEAELSAPPLRPPPGADVRRLTRGGQDVTALEPYLVAGKVTVFDFYADWCPPCRKVDAHLYPIAAARPDLAVRKIDIGSWESPVAEHWLGSTAELPFLLVYDKRGHKVASLSGGDLRELDHAIAEASQ